MSLWQTRDTTDDYNHWKTIRGRPRSTTLNTEVTSTSDNPFQAALTSCHQTSDTNHVIQDLAAVCEFCGALFWLTGTKFTLQSQTRHEPSTLQSSVMQRTNYYK
ncbi:hypothetical protein M8C21_016727 [Ambrosia artemisiifolia]|uniref:Uncharacterized protein n=1 Tax=Ambrosia artemisiifolia TaxID=4212 RepID=A0AAD5CUD7_AMBAR|nr:hypothetical protein M8C21_016727 [Ambrosia artemisiifolia]